MIKLITQLKLLTYPTTINQAANQWQITRQHARNRLTKATDNSLLLKLRHHRVLHFTPTSIGLYAMLKD